MTPIIDVHAHVFNALDIRIDESDFARALCSVRLTHHDRYLGRCRRFATVRGFGNRRTSVSGKHHAWLERTD